MTNENGVMHAFLLDKKGGGRALGKGEVECNLKEEGTLAWVHLTTQDPDSKEWLSGAITYLDHIIADALFDGETRPRMIEFEDGMLLNLRGVNLNENAEPEDMISIRVWVDKDRVISVQRRQLRVIIDIKERIDSGHGPKNAGEFLVSLVSGLCDRMDPVMIELDEELDEIEQQVMENPDVSQRKPMTGIRKQAILMRRYIAPQRDVISQVRTSNQEWLSETHRRRLQESLDRITRYVEELDTIRERAQIVKDELTNALSDRMNKNMYVLSVVAAIFLPLGFLTGLLGINIGGMPGEKNDNAFWIFCGMLVVITTTQYFIFKKLKWF